MLYFGGKSRWIDIVSARIGKVGVWSEPCCGTAVMTLEQPRAGRQGSDLRPQRLHLQLLPGGARRL